MAADLIILPCFNEAGRLPQSEVEAFLQADADCALLFVDDGSTDGTADVLAALAGRWPGRVHWLRLGRNHGKAGAVRAGVQSEWAQCEWQSIGFLDADLATPLREMRRLQTRFHQMPELRLLTGLRLLRLGAGIQRRASRHYPGRVLATVISLLLGIGVYDTQCGAKVMRTADARQLFREPFSSSWLFDVELFARQQILLGRREMLATTREEPLEVWVEKGGSRITPMDVLRLPLELLRIWRRYRRPLREAARR